MTIGQNLRQILVMTGELGETQNQLWNGKMKRHLSLSVRRYELSDCRQSTFHCLSRLLFFAPVKPLCSSSNCNVVQFFVCFILFGLSYSSFWIPISTCAPVQIHHEFDPFMLHQDRLPQQYSAVQMALIP